MTPVLEVRDLVKQYPGVRAVDGVSFAIAEGVCFGLLGPNGAGKTTTFYMTVGLTVPDSGRVILDGEDVTDDGALLVGEPARLVVLGEDQLVHDLQEARGIDGEVREELVGLARVFRAEPVRPRRVLHAGHAADVVDVPLRHLHDEGDLVARAQAILRGVLGADLP